MNDFITNLQTNLNLIGVFWEPSRPIWQYDNDNDCSKEVVKLFQSHVILMPPVAAWLISTELITLDVTVIQI